MEVYTVYDLMSSDGGYLARADVNEDEIIELRRLNDYI